MRLLVQGIGAGVLLVIFILAAFSFHLTYFAHQPIIDLEAGVTIEIQPGTSAAGVGQLIAQQLPEFSAQRFKILARLRGAAHRIQTGEYYLPPGSTPWEILEKIEIGKVVQHSFSIIEGWSMQQVLLALQDEPTIIDDVSTLTADELIDKLHIRIHATIPIQQYPHETFPPFYKLEGLLLPDTYFFPRHTKASEILQRAHLALMAVLEQETTQFSYNDRISDPYAVLILASIIEKETAVNSEYRTIAGVYTRRLKLKMRLQADPTVMYGLQKYGQGMLSRKDLRQASPYNTYRIKGLPPTPIAMPSEEAILAALNPAAGSALYFVATGKGDHIFSDNLEAHKQAVQQYRAFIKNASTTP